MSSSGVLRQITHERDPGVTVGVPVWSPPGDAIAFVSSREAIRRIRPAHLARQPGRKQLAKSRHSRYGASRGQPDGGLRLFQSLSKPEFERVWLFKIAAEGGHGRRRVRPTRFRNTIGPTGKTLYFVLRAAPGRRLASDWRSSAASARGRAVAPSRPGFTLPGAVSGSSSIRRCHPMELWMAPAVDRRIQHEHLDAVDVDR